LYIIERLGKAFADFLFPLYCIGCGKEGAILCDSCAAKLDRLVPPFCPRCGLPETGRGDCPDCSGLDLSIDGICSPLIFRKLTREAIHQLKYHNMRVMAVPLANILHSYLAENPIEADFLVPVPLHPKRLRERGYNQSLLLARHLGKLACIAVREDVIKRCVNTPPQARTGSSAERHSNMRGAFACTYGKLKDKKVLLIDDVSTSGATLDACALALKKAGAASVRGLTVAREV
jgi:ComF family protein